MGRQIGIDFGTTTTSMAYCDNENEVQYVIIQKKYTVRTAIAESIDNNAELYGNEAVYCYERYNDIQENFKLGLESANLEKRKKSEDLTVRYFKFLWTSYKAYEKTENISKESVTIDRTVVTYPEKYKEEQCNFLKKVAEDAGFPNVMMVSEVDAAVMYFIKHGDDEIKTLFVNHLKIPMKILMIDMGGITTKINIFDYLVGHPEYDKNTKFYIDTDKHKLGGNVIDDELYKYYYDCSGQKLKEDGKDRRRYANIIKEYKESNILKALEDNVNVCAPYGIRDYIDKDKGVLDREKFERIYSEYIDGFINFINKVKDIAGSIDLILLVGGNSYWYFIYDILAKPEMIDLPKIQKEPFRILTEKQYSANVIAQGAACYKKEYVPPLTTISQTVNETNLYEKQYASFRPCPKDCLINFKDDKGYLCKSFCSCDEVCTVFDRSKCSDDYVDCHIHYPKSCDCDYDCSYDCYNETEFCSWLTWA